MSALWLLVPVIVCGGLIALCIVLLVRYPQMRPQRRRKARS